jgi:hypothetical protein
MALMLEFNRKYLGHPDHDPRLLPSVKRFMTTTSCSLLSAMKSVPMTHI